MNGDILPNLDGPIPHAVAKREIALRYWLHGRGYFSALRALELVSVFEAGEFRKGGGIPALDHFVEIALFTSRLPGIRDMETQLVVVLLHDLVEDYGVPLEAVEFLFGPRAAPSIWNMTKKLPILAGGTPIDVSHMTPDGSSLILHRGGEVLRTVDRDEDELYAAMASDEFASIGKPSDRAHNQKTMSGVFGANKQVGYVDFTARRILPMVEIARRRFPHQEGAYVILETLLKTQERIVRGWAADHAPHA